MQMHGAKLVRGYRIIKDVLVEAGFGGEIAWQESLRLGSVSESEFLRESAWVMLAAGMRESVIRLKFPYLSCVFKNWVSAEAIVEGAAGCRIEALRYFNHPGKVGAIIEMARRVSSLGFGEVKSRISREGLDFLTEFPYIGPRAALHLGKNLGLEVAKPDRHLIRIALVLGFETPQLLCETIAAIVGDRVSVVDLVLWRFASLYPDYLKFFAEEMTRP